MNKKIINLLLAVIVLFGCLPCQVWATEESQPTEAVVEHPQEETQPETTEPETARPDAEQVESQDPVTADTAYVTSGNWEYKITKNIH